MLFVSPFRVGTLMLLVCAVASAGGAAGGGLAKTKHGVVLSPFQQAVKAREVLEATSPETRTRAAYAGVLDAFRAVYHDAPRDAHAADAVRAVAELLAQQGRDFSDAKSSTAAVGQYEFLRIQYPTSRLHAEALLAEARIEEQDLGDVVLARQKYSLLVKEDARGAAGIAAREALAAGKVGSGKQVARAEAVRLEAVPAARKLMPVAAVPVSDFVPSAMAMPVAAGGPAKALATVTGIRHWSTATYTRVAIDLGDEITFEAARVPHPDRIFFDLHGTRLGAELLNRSFDVTDDGFLKKIRAAQSSADVTRVVLDVNDVTEYSAFLLPNPYRLIIDIHGRKRDAAGGASPALVPTPTKVQAQHTATRPEASRSEQASEPAQRDTNLDVPVPAAAGRQASAAANVSGLPAMAPTDGGGAVRAPQAEIAAATVVASKAPAPRVGAVSRATVGHPVPNTVAVKEPATTVEVAAVSSLPGKVDATSAPTSRPIAAVTPGARRGKKDEARRDEAGPVRAAARTLDGQTSLIRALGLKIGRIVIDAGHGGHDSGTLGADGIQEKDVVLDVALRLGKLLHDRLGAEIIYTRSDDTFIPLETRTAIANKAQADLFLSIHANSSSDESARGVETYYLNFTSDATALDVAARENAVSGQSIHQLSDLVKKITLKDKIAESREFAEDVEGSLYRGLERGNDGLKNRGVKKAPFVVLIGANMPSILAEISFVTNRKDATQLRQPEYRQRVAESLFKGVEKYEAGLANPKAMTGSARASLE